MISAPPIVGVPAFARCDCGPSLRMTCPTFTSVSLRMIAGPASSDTASAVSVPMIVRNVRYWNRWKPLIHSRSNAASSSSIAGTSVAGRAAAEGGDDPVHRGRTRTLDQQHESGAQLGARRVDQRGLVLEVARAGAECVHRGAAVVAGREQALDPAAPRERADVGVQA